MEIPQVKKKKKHTGRIPVCGTKNEETINAYSSFFATLF